MVGKNDDTNAKQSKEAKNDSSAADYAPNDYGWDTYLYPERRGGEFKRNWLLTLIGYEGREGLAKIKCERNIYKCVKNSPIIKLMLGALKSSGCDFDIRRHISCEICDGRVSGGYDPITNQVVICQNVARSEGRVNGTLVHELVHMFDYCRNELDFKNIDHVACTEVRAANLANCSYLGALVQGIIPSFSVKKAHQMCVKDRATISVLAVRKVSREEAEAAVERVFTRCYSDLEPVGRRVKRNSSDMLKAYKDGFYYGYHA